MLKALGVALTLTAGLLTGVAFAGEDAAVAGSPNAHASCMGHESAAISPPGSSDEIPGGRPEFNEFIKTLGGPPGAIKSQFAKLHEGSHEACDEATE